MNSEKYKSSKKLEVISMSYYLQNFIPLFEVDIEMIFVIILTSLLKYNSN